MAVGDHPGAPVPHFDGLDPESGHLGILAPVELLDGMEPAHQVAIAALHHHRNITWQGAQGSEIGVVHVGVREQQHVGAGKLARLERRLDQPPRAKLDGSTADADPRLECRIGEDPDTVKIEQHRRMAEPGGGEPVAGPVGWTGAVRGGQRDRVHHLADQLQFTTESWRTQRAVNFLPEYTRCLRVSVVVSLSGRVA